MSKKAAFILAIVALVAFSQQTAQAAVISYYMDANFEGWEQNTLDVQPDICVNLQYLNDKLSSINTHGACINVFVDADCVGASYRIEPGSDCHNNLGQCGLNDMVNSFRLC